MSNNLTQKMKKQLKDMSSNLLYLRNSSYKNNEGREYADEQIRNIFDDWDKLKIPKWKQNLMFDKVETFIENDWYSISNMNSDVKNILNE